MNIHACAFSSESDFRAMEVLACATRADNLHVTDPPYRLSAVALDYQENICWYTGRIIRHCRNMELTSDG